MITRPAFVFDLWTLELVAPEPDRPVFLPIFIPYKPLCFKGPSLSLVGLVVAVVLHDKN